MKKYNQLQLMYLQKILLSVLVCSSLFGESYWVRYGWQGFKNSGDARSLSLGQTQTAGYSGPLSVLQNPAHSRNGFNQYLYAHQSRFAGLVNSDLMAFPTLKGFRSPVNVLLFHEGVSTIPDTRNILLDWGNDGVPGTGDSGENNGLLDEGERLDANQVSYFRQSQWGIHLSTAWKIKNWDVGVGMKGLFHSLAEHYSSGIGLDLGAKRSFWKGNSVGVVVTDATTSWLIWENGSVERFTPEFFTGISQEFSTQKIPINFSIMTDFSFDIFGRSIDDDFQLGEMGGRYRAGLEIQYSKFSVRFGRGFNGLRSAGLGLDWEHLAIHYAFTTAGNSPVLGDSHLLSFRLDPKWLLVRVKNVL